MKSNSHKYIKLCFGLCIRKGRVESMTSSRVFSRKRCRINVNNHLSNNKLLYLTTTKLFVVVKYDELGQQVWDYDQYKRACVYKTIVSTSISQPFKHYTNGHHAPWRLRYIYSHKVFGQRNVAKLHGTQLLFSTLGGHSTPNGSSQISRTIRWSNAFLFTRENDPETLAYLFTAPVYVWTECSKRREQKWVRFLQEPLSS